MQRIAGPVPAESVEIWPDAVSGEVLGWVLYVVPVLAISLWPRAWRPSRTRVPAVRTAVAAVLAVAAATLAIAVPTGSVDLPHTTAVTGGAA